MYFRGGKVLDIQHSEQEKPTGNTIVTMQEDQQLPAFDFDQWQLRRRRSLGRLLWKMKRFFDSRMEERLEALGHVRFQLSYLVFLSNIEKNGTTASDLARRAGVTKQAMSKVVRLLEEEGYIYSRRSEQDSRVIRLFLNERGKTLFLDLYEVMQDIRRRFYEIAGEQAVEQMIDTMLTIVAHLEEKGET